MRKFADLYETLDSTTRTSRKVSAIAAYLSEVPPEDAAWAVFFLTGRRLKRLISGRTLRAWAQAQSGLPEWLVTDAHAAVGDSAETVALLLGQPAGQGADVPLHAWIEDRILPLRGRAPDVQAQAIAGFWAELSQHEMFVLNKLLTGALRVGVARALVVRALVVRALAGLSGLPAPTIAHRLMGDPEPSAGWYRSLLDPERTGEDRSRPYPFFLASTLDQPVASLGRPEQWLIEWKWDGIRAQLIRRGAETFLWSRGEELITGRFPEVAAAAERLPDGTVLDGEILAWNAAGVLPFSALQTRIGRDRLSPRLLQEVPAAFLAYDLIESDGRDLRSEPQARRRERLVSLMCLDGDRLRLSEAVEGAGWDDLAGLRDEARARRVEGLMLKRRDAPYGVGRQRGAWWKWKVEPFTVDAVLLYAQAGSGRRSNLFTDYTFAVWQDTTLVPVAKAYSGLDDQEIGRLDRWIRRHTIERFGPARSVHPVQVFELAFEGISRSARHKSGLAVRLPRIVRWRHDKVAADADRIEHLQALLPPDP